jgi:membrane-associated protease RseP (regulator of RpoE activity)
MKRLLFAVIFLALGMPATAQQDTGGRAPGAAWIGITYDLRWVQDRGGCVSQMVVEGVVPGSPADRAGVRAGDAVIAIDGDRTPAARLPVLTGQLRPGDSVRLLIDRAGSAREVTVVADRRPDRPAATATQVRPPGMAITAGPVVMLRGDTLIATNVTGGFGGARSPSSGYWLSSEDGSLTYRRVRSQPASELDRRAAALLVCADTAGRALPVTAVRVDIERIQERAESLRVVIARRALEHRADDSRGGSLYQLVPALPAPPAAGAPPREAMVFRAEEAMIASLRGVAGAELFTMEPELGEYFRGVSAGLLVLRVATGSAAERSGLRPGDVITAAAGRSVTAPAELRALLTAPGSGPIELAVVRQGRRRTVSLPRP